MELKTTIAAVVLVFGVSALVSQIDLGGGTEAAPAVGAAKPDAPPASGHTYAALLAQTDEHIAGLQKRVSGRPSDWLTRMHLATALLERGRLTNQLDDFARVQAVLDEAFAIAPAGSGPLLLAARFNFAIHRLEAAEKYLDVIEGRNIPRRDDLIGARALRAEIALQRGQYDAAFEGLTEVAAVAPAIATAELALYHAKTGNPAEATALLEEALAATNRKDPRRRAWIELQLGVVAMDRGELPTALKRLQAADAELAGWWLVQENIAEIHNRRDEHAAAAAIYEELVRTVDLPQHMDALAALYRHMGRTQEAEALIARAGARWEEQLARFPEAAMGHGLQHHLQFGTPERALELALANHALRPGGEAQVALARAYLKAGRAAEALAAAEKALATPYRSAGLHDVAAKAHAALGHTAEAEDQIAACFAINPWYSGDDHSH